MKKPSVIRLEIAFVGYNCKCSGGIFIWQPHLIASTFHGRLTICEANLICMHDRGEEYFCPALSLFLSVFFSFSLSIYLSLLLSLTHTHRQTLSLSFLTLFLFFFSSVSLLSSSFLFSVWSYFVFFLLLSYFLFLLFS
jgi:hypothetical protein